MVGIVIVSHSKKLAHEIIELCNEMKKYDFPVINGSGTTGNHLRARCYGTTIQIIGLQDL